MLCRRMDPVPFLDRNEGLALTCRAASRTLFDIRLHGVSGRGPSRPPWIGEALGNLKYLAPERFFHARMRPPRPRWEVEEN